MVRMKNVFLFCILALVLASVPVQAWDDPVTRTWSASYYPGILDPALTSYKDYYDADFYGTTGWMAYGTTGAWLKYDFGSSIELRNVVLWNWAGDWYPASNRGVQDFTLSFSNDDVTYSDPISFTALEAISSSAEPSQVFEFLPVTARYAKVTCVSNYGEGSFTGIGQLRYNDPLIPVEPTPADGATGVARDTTLSWVPFDAGSVIDYDVYFGTDPNVTTQLLSASTVTTADPTPGVGELLDYGITYYWKVVTNYQILPEPNEPNLVSQLFSFTTEVPSPVVTDISPLMLVIGTGETAQVTVTGTNLEFYQWYKEGDPDTQLTNIGDISGADTATLSIANVEEADEGKYYCVVSNSLSVDTDQSASATLLTERLIAHWTFDGSLADSQGDWPGTWSGSTVPYVTGADGTANGAIAFDGTAHIDIIGSEDYFTFHPYGLTVTAWMKNVAEGDSSDYMRLFSKVGDYEIVAFDTGYSYGFIGSGAGGTSVISGDDTGQWRLAVLTYDPDGGTEGLEEAFGVYKGAGAQVASLYSDSRDTAPDTTPDATVVRIGAASEPIQSSIWILDGVEVDDVRVYNYPLSPQEIAQLYTDMLGDSVCSDITAATLLGDLDGNCEVNLADFAIFASTWFNSEFFN